MATFPSLKTGAVAQYPAIKSLRFQNQIVRFVDGNEQRYRDSAGPLHQWVIRLDQLDETELASLESFFLSNQGSFASFIFIDPWNATSYPNCSIGSDQLQLTSVEELQNATSVTVTENRG
ncbi:MAG: DUF2460 domain-containing protein [Bryobacteraceae bacterium]|jgi:hypothetical protein